MMKRWAKRARYLINNIHIITKKMGKKIKDLQASAENTTKQKGEGKWYIPEQELEDMNEVLQTTLENFMLINPESSLSEAERRRLQGSGVRRYGFIDKVSDIALANPEFVPSYLDLEQLKKYLRDIENLRNISVTLQQLSRMNSDLSLIISDEAFRLALMYYNAVRDAARRRVPGAEAIFRVLQLFFRRPRRSSEEPTEPEVERDVKALLHGKKDGKIVIENETPQKKGGKHVVIDETHRDKMNFRESEGGEIVEK
jgi:hypothetical protein